ncbi:hypothetical protein D3C87_1885910 [compost metagenome]
MPRSLWRKATREARSRALRNSNFGKVSAWPAVPLATIAFSLTSRHARGGFFCGPVPSLVLMQALQAGGIFARRRLTDNSPLGD